jgi:hypothetical protein
MAGLYQPERGGMIGELRPFLNVGSDADFYLIVAWPLAALNTNYLRAKEYSFARPRTKER